MGKYDRLFGGGPLRLREERPRLGIAAGDRDTSLLEVDKTGRSVETPSVEKCWLQMTSTAYVINLSTPLLHP